MEQQYQVTGPRPVNGARPGEMFVAELDATEEADLLAAGRVVIVPATFRVIGGSTVHGAAPGETFSAALPAAQLGALMAGGHIELVPAATGTDTRPGRKRQDTTTTPEATDADGSKEGS